MDLAMLPRSSVSSFEFYQVHHITSSPHHPRSNGFAKALMGIAKRLMDKAIKDGKPWNYGLLQYRVTLISSTIPSPLEALTGRKPRTSLPQVPSTIGRTVDGSRICQELIKRQPSVSRQYSLSQDSKPYQQAIQLHQHCSNHPYQWRGRTLPPVPEVPPVLPLPHRGDQSDLQRASHPGGTLPQEYRPC